MKLIKWIGDPNTEEKHRHNYRWIKDKKKREEWIRKNWKSKEEEIDHKVDKSVKFLTLLILFIHSILIISNIINLDILKIVILIVTSILILIPIYLIKNKKIGIPAHIILLYYILIFFSLTLGSALGLFLKYWWLDGLLHFYSGILITYVCYYYFTNINKEIRNIALPVSFILLFSVFLNSFISILWEIYEFLMDIFLNLNMQENGLVDTMYDFIISLIGSILAYIGIKK